jgi:aminoglycoside 3'-phosphotransferase II
MVNFTAAHLRTLVPSLAPVFRMERVSTGQSTAAVFRLFLHHGAIEYLKVDHVDSPDPIRLEHENMVFLASVGIAVAEIKEYGCVNGVEFLRTKAVLGYHVDATDSPYDNDIVIGVFASMLRTLHAAPTRNCRSHRPTAELVQIAEQRFLAGHVDIDDFDDARSNVDPVELIRYLKRAMPTEDLTVTHGDATGSNILIVSPEPSGVFIDVGRSGIANRWYDLALAERSIRDRWGDAAVTDFFDRYGLRPDPGKLEYFHTLDEFF